MSETIIFHIDVNSAFLSWEACYRKEIYGDINDLRDVPSVIGGNQEMRHGIVLAKSIPAKKFNIQTGEPLVSARQKCPNLIVVQPNYGMYVECSRKFIELLKEYAPIVEQYSIDEAFCDFTGTEKIYGSPVIFANYLKNEIKRRLGFTVNIGVGNNKLLAKMASDFKKPDLVHTLFENEVKSKLWPLPVGDLFYVGRASKKKLNLLGMQKIGELANADLNILKLHLKSHGEVIWNYANGVDTQNLNVDTVLNKGYGNSLTIHYDVTDDNTAKMVILSLCETVGARIRADKAYISVVAISIVDFQFNHLSHQTTLLSGTNVTEKIYETACTLFDKAWNHVSIRQLGVHTAKASTENSYQYNIFDKNRYDKLAKLNESVDHIRSRYGEDSVMRACFIGSKHSHLTGGIDKEKRTGITKGV